VRNGKHIGALCEVKPDEPEAKKPKRKKKTETPEEVQAKQNMIEAVKFAWKITDGEKAKWKVTKLAAFLTGKVFPNMAKRYGEEFYECQLKTDEESGTYPATPQEVVAFGHWYKFTYEQITMPEKGATLLNQFQTFRGHQSYEAYLRKADNTIREQIPAMVIPGAVQTEEEPQELMEGAGTPELKAKVDAMLDDLF
jgi:hypothetical protein